MRKNVRWDDDDHFGNNRPVEKDLFEKYKNRIYDYEEEEDFLDDEYDVWDEWYEEPLDDVSEEYN